MLYENKMKTKLKSGKAVMTVALNFVDAGLAEFLGRLGYDAATIDTEHGVLVDREVLDFVRACDLAGITPLVRGLLDQVLMQRYLDIGVHGVEVGHVESVERAREIVDAVKFRPIGKRGTGRTRSTDFGFSAPDWSEYAANANAQTLIKLAIEDVSGLDALPEIVKIPEIDVISFGTGDLADSMGLAGQRHHPKVVRAVDDAIAIVRAAGKAAGLPVFVPDDVAKVYARGARFLVGDVPTIVAQGAGPYLRALAGLN